MSVLCGMLVVMPIQRIKEDIKRHRPIDWFAMVVLISVAVVVMSMVTTSVDQFIYDMENVDREAQQATFSVFETKVRMTTR